MLNAPTIEVANLESHFGFITALFKDHPWYSFDRINEHVYNLYNLSNGKQLNFKQAIGALPERVGLVTFMCMDKEDFDYRTSQIELLGGTIRAEATEIRPNHFSVWADSPCSWSFGLSYF